MRGSEKYKEGPLPGRIVLYLFDHPAGAAQWQIEEAIIDSMDNGLLKRALDELETADKIEVSAVSWHWHKGDSGYTRDINGAIVGYRLTTASWLKMARAIQDAG